MYYIMQFISNEVVIRRIASVIRLSPSQISEDEHPVDLPAADASPRGQDSGDLNAEGEGLDETIFDQDDMMLEILTAADVELDMDEEMEEKDILDDESDLSGDEVAVD